MNSILFLSLSHRIDRIKMNVLPWYLLLFQALPVEIPIKHKTISKYIWWWDKPRVEFKTLQLLQEEGGMAPPHFKDYYYAAQLNL